MVKIVALQKMFYQELTCEWHSQVSVFGEYVEIFVHFLIVFSVQLKLSESTNFDLRTVESSVTSWLNYFSIFG